MIAQTEVLRPQTMPSLTPILFRELVCAHPYMPACMGRWDKNPTDTMLGWPHLPQAALYPLNNFNFMKQ